jgi:hypothetical protein
MDAELLDLMPASVTIYSCTGTDLYGKRQFAPTPIFVRGRLGVAKTQESSRVDTTDATFWCAGVFAIKVEDRCVLPDGSAPEITKVHTYEDEIGPYQTTLTLMESS